MGGGAADRHRLARPDPPRGPVEARLLHRPRPVAELHQPLGAELRHAELCRAWRVLLGQHGRRRHLYHRRRVLGIRPAGLGAHQAIHALRRGGGSRQQPDQDGDRQSQGARRADDRGESDPHRLQRGGRRVGGNHAGHRRALHPGDGACAAEGRADRHRLPRAVHQRAGAGQWRSGQRRARPLPARRSGPRAGHRPPHRQARAFR